MTKAMLWPRILDWDQRSAFVLQNLNCFPALGDSASALQLGKDDSGPEFPAVIFDRENPRVACRNHCLRTRDGTLGAPLARESRIYYSDSA